MIDAAETEVPIPIPVEVESVAPITLPIAPNLQPWIARRALRTSLWASTMDGIFAAIFSNIAGGVLLSHFLIELKASAFEIGLLSSIPMVVNLLQPLGAFLGDRTTSRHYYCLWIFGTSRLLWLMLVVGIGMNNLGLTNPHRLVVLTLAIVLATHFLGSLGSSSWLSWMATLVPARLRGRYFGLRNSAGSLTTLLCVPIAGWVISNWLGGAIQGYGVVLLVGVIAGLISIGFQNFMVDVNPQVQNAHPNQSGIASEEAPASGLGVGEWTAALWEILQQPNFLRFLLYFSGWMFAVNLSAPFFNFYLLETLQLDVTWVTLYNSLHSGAHLLLLMLWGRIADRIGNRSVLTWVGILVAITPLLWLGVGTRSLDLWLVLPLLHLLAGATWSAIDLCSNNLQLGVAPMRHQSSYFAIAAAVAGVSGALGTTLGGVLAELPTYGGVLGVFALSSVLRLLALIPLVFVREERSRSLLGSPVITH
ncbi:MAG: MFS transporter [Leptolyngbyaceae cyanobacterium SL_7_1]|nr:MFS transporter [Leptolyngbyaceae cyanobacterium SL_7_1]